VVAVEALAPDYRRLVETAESGGEGGVGLTMREVAVAVGRDPVAAVTERSGRVPGDPTVRCAPSADANQLFSRSSTAAAASWCSPAA
jgi:hypothetical protein